MQLSIHTELDNRNYVPGEQVRGHVEWSGGDPSEPAGSAELRLFFYTRGKGTRDVELVDLMVMHE
ncbi:MAG: hypothetical protein HKN23_18275, partial [Verrucomicrobiales bacterium]|nr:hypothetical protein [Verrucomicrobiales bacterium]